MHVMELINFLFFVLSKLYFAFFYTLANNMKYVKLLL